MNNYSFLQRKLHQLALSSQIMREAMFDAETSLISTERVYDKHVFVSGLARSGTTVLLNAIHRSNEFSSLSYKDMPFVLAPNLWSKVCSDKKNIKYIERAHGDGITVSVDSPEAFEEVFWMTFDEGDEDTKEKFRGYVYLINKRYSKKRYLSKNNQNIKRLELITKIFPNSKIIIPFRNPIQQANSLFSQHQRFIKYSKSDAFISDYMKWIGHTEFGPNYVPIHREKLRFSDDLDINHWLEQWYLTYFDCFRRYRDNTNVHFISYEQLCASKKHWLSIMQSLDIKHTYDVEFKKTHKEITIQFDPDIYSEGLSLYYEILRYCC